MRKQLLVGTALAAATMLAAGGALAADKKMAKPSISVNGFFAHEIGTIANRSMETKRLTHGAGTDGNFHTADSPSTDDTMTTSKMSNEVDTSALDSRNDAEIHFNGSATLDNGVAIAVRVELEGNTDGDQIDESFMTISGSFGQVTLGSDDNAPDKMLLGYSGQWATRVGSAPFLRGVAWVPDASGLGPNGRYSGLNWGGDASKITYISPQLGGFSVGVSYTPSGTEDSNANPDADADYHNGLSGAMAYSGSFGDVSFGGGVGYTAAQAGNDSGMDDLAMWGVAAKLGFGPVTVAAGYKAQTDPMPDRHDVIDLGVNFVSGANSFSLSGSHGEADDGGASLTIAVASYARTLGPGVKWFSDIIWNQSESGMSMSDNATAASFGLNDAGNAVEVTEAVAATERYMDKSENSGIALVTGISVSF